MANQQATFNLGIKTTADLTGINNLKKAFDDIRKLGETNDANLLAKLGATPDELNNAIVTVNHLEGALNRAYNPKLNTINVTKFKDEIIKTYGSVDVLRDRLSYAGTMGEKAFFNMSASLMQISPVIRQSQTWLNKLSTSFLNVVRYQAFNTVLNNISGSIQQSYGYIKSLDKSLTNIQVVTEKSADNMKQFAKEANNAAKSLGSTTTEYTDASLIYYQQGLDDTAVQGRTDTTIKMANVLGATASEVSDYMTAIWNNFDDGSKSLDYYGDVIVKLGSETASSAEEIATGMGKFAAVAETVGLSYEYATASLATVVAETRQSADTVGTAFKTLFARIQDLELGDDGSVSLGKYAEALHKIGIEVLDQNGNMKQMDDLLDEMGSKWGTLTQAQQTALAQNVAGKLNRLVA